MTAVVMETLETGRYPLTGDSTNAANHDGCWLVNHSPWSLGLALVLPVVVLAAITVVTYLKTMAVARGARQLLLTDDQFNHISHCLSFVMKLLPLLTATLLLAVVATIRGRNTTPDAGDVATDTSTSNICRRSRGFSDT